jgi:hypothetical protein
VKRRAEERDLFLGEITELGAKKNPAPPAV